MLKDHQKRHLKSLAHPLKPVVIIGASGFTDAVLNEIDIALNHHELIKIRVNAGDREARGELIAQICERAQAELIQRIGHVATVFRRNPQKPRIALP